VDIKKVIDHRRLSRAENAGFDHGAGCNGGRNNRFSGSELAA
jgi:hypothetical protein